MHLRGYVLTAKERQPTTVLHKRYDDARYAADPIGQRARSAAWKAAHPEQDAKTKRAWYEANAVSERARVTAWRAGNPEKMRQQLANRRGRKAGNGGSHTLTEWREKRALFNNLCAYCGESKPLTRDHKLPLSRGGTDDIMNIIPACRPCNSKKRTKTADEFRSLMPTNDASTGLIRIA